MGKDAVAGRQLKATFLKKTPALKYLIDAVKDSAKRGHLIGLDKRHVHVRSAHSALNTLLQGAGALVCKAWIYRTNQLLQEWGYKHGWDGDYALMAWVHDEQNFAARTQEVAEAVGRASREAMKYAEQLFNFRCPLDVDVKYGLNWAEVH